MIAQEERRKALQTVKRCLIKTHDEIEGTADFFESQLPTEYDRATCREYGMVCRTLGILEKQIASIGNQINQLK
jgi:hypothetical protein